MCNKDGLVLEPAKGEAWPLPSARRSCAGGGDLAANGKAQTIFVRRRYSPLQKALKATERFLKDAALAVVMRVAAPRVDGAPEWNGGKLRVLFLRHDKIGDMILSTGIIHAIANSHPNIELHVLASPSNAAVIEKDPLVHQVLTFDVHRFKEYPRLLKKFRRLKYDMVVDCMVFSQSLTTMLLMLATGAPHRVGVLKRNKPNIYTMFGEPAGRDAHHVEHLAQLASPFGIAAEEALQLGITLTEAEHAAALAQWQAEKRVLVNISVGKAFRQWPDDNFVAVARHLKERCPEAHVMILHAPGELDRARTIAGAAGVGVAETPGVRNALAMVAAADFVFTPDTSVVHAASVFHVPTVAMMTADHLIRWGLYDTHGEMVASVADTLDIVPLGQVLAAIGRVLSSLPQFYCVVPIPPATSAVPRASAL
jgi:ADP-heptose:LPS heptosyltransferase